MENMTPENVVKLAEAIAQALDGKKALDIKTLPVGKHTTLADFFITATGTSSTHIKALADEVEFRTREDLNIVPGHIEGMRESGWVLMDYGSVVVHLFTQEAREFYKLDKLWADSGLT